MPYFSLRWANAQNENLSFTNSLRRSIHVAFPISLSLPVLRLTTSRFNILFEIWFTDIASLLIFITFTQIGILNKFLFYL